MITHLYIHKEVINQFIDAFSELSYDDISIEKYLHTTDTIFLSKRNKRIIRFRSSGVDIMDVLICKPRYSWLSVSSKKFYNKYYFYTYDIVKHFPNNNLMLFDNYKYDINELTELYLNTPRKRSHSMEESENILKSTVREHILFLKSNLLPVITGEMWIDELIKKQKK